MLPSPFRGVEGKQEPPPLRAKVPNPLFFPEWKERLLRLEGAEADTFFQLGEVALTFLSSLPPRGFIRIPLSSGKKVYAPAFLLLLHDIRSGFSFFSNVKRQFLLHLFPQFGHEIRPPPRGN